MKRISLICLSVVMLGALVYAATNVVSVNIVGYNKVTCPGGKFVLVSTEFESLDGSPLKSVDVFGDQLPLGSTIYAYDAGIANYVIDSKNFLGWSTNITYNGSMGFWISVPAGPSYTVSLLGEVPMASQVSTEVASGFTMLSYPYPADVLWTNTALAKSAQLGDTLYTWNTNGAGSYVINSLNFLGWANPNAVLSPGMGFWYSSVSATNFMNTEVRPYNP